MRGGEIIDDRYRLIAPLGRGGMAEVWRAHDERLERSVAIKFLAAQLTQDPEFLLRFFTEAQAAASISHPNVVQVLDFGQHEDNPYLVMELVSGGGLAERMGTPLGMEEAFHLIAAAARGAGAAHEAGIVHRDLKPANILLDEDGEPKVADFGIAASSRLERLTATGAAIGSPHYISPEQATGGLATPRSDVYSLGIVLFELLTGRRPFQGDNVTAVAIAHVEQDPPAPSSIAEDLDPRVDTLVLKCLDKDPDERFANGTELAAALSRGTGPLAVLENLVGAVEGKTGWAHRKTLIGAALLVLILSTVAVSMVAGRDDAEPPKKDAYDRLDNVGGLRSKKTRSPSLEEEDTEIETTPTPTKSTPRPSRSPAPKATPRERRDPDPDPEPTPDETAEPSPEPSESGGP